MQKGPDAGIRALRPSPLAHFLRDSRNLRRFRPFRAEVVQIAEGVRSVTVSRGAHNLSDSRNLGDCASFRTDVVRIAEAVRTKTKRPGPARGPGRRRPRVRAARRWWC
ncbi:hypothetical protein CHE218_08880 [Microbacterium sp. che218]